MQSQIEVELDVFSGMPNPTWVLTDQESDQFLALLRELPESVPREWSGNLGYRGFTLRVMRETGVQSIRIQAGNIEISSGPARRHMADTGRRLERWVFDTGRSLLAPEIVQLVERQIK